MFNKLNQESKNVVKLTVRGKWKLKFLDRKPYFNWNILFILNCTARVDISSVGLYNLIQIVGTNQLIKTLNCDGLMPVLFRQTQDIEPSSTVEIYSLIQQLN